MFKTTIKVYNQTEYRFTRSYENASGYDLYNFEKEIVIKPYSILSVPTGIFLEMHPDENFSVEGQIRSKSGLSLKGINVFNSPGTIDSDFRGEICVILRNSNRFPFKIKPGVAIAQIVFCPVIIPTIKMVSNPHDLSLTIRQDKGFGSTDGSTD